MSTGNGLTCVIVIPFSVYIKQMRCAIADTHIQIHRHSYSELIEPVRSQFQKGAGLECKPLRKANKIISLQIMPAMLDAPTERERVRGAEGEGQKERVELLLLHTHAACCKLLPRCMPHDARTLNRLCQMIEITS